MVEPSTPPDLMQNDVEKGTGSKHCTCVSMVSQDIALDLSIL